MEEGIAHLYFISNNQTILHGKITQSILKKRTGSSLKILKLQIID